MLDKQVAIRVNDYMFTSSKGNAHVHGDLLADTLRRLGCSDLTAHGLRSTFTDWCAEKTNFPEEVCKMAAAHAVGDKVEAAYRRNDLFDKRRQLAETWARLRDALSGCGRAVSKRAANGVTADMVMAKGDEGEPLARIRLLKHPLDD